MDREADHLDEFESLFRVRPDDKVASEAQKMPTNFNIERKKAKEQKGNNPKVKVSGGLPPSESTNVPI